MRFSFRLDPLWRGPLLLIGARRSGAWVDLGEEALQLRFGFFSARIPLADVHGARRIDWPFYYGIGVRLAPRRTIGYIGSQRGVVEVRLRRARRFSVIVPVERERVALSLQAPDAFIDALSEAIAGSRARAGEWHPTRVQR